MTMNGEIIEELTEDKCPKCGEILFFNWENNGFSEPDPTHYEIVSEYCKACGYHKGH